MSRARSVLLAGPGAFVLAAALALVATAAWVLVVRDAAQMTMHAPGASPSLAEAATFVGQWGLMMAAMMLPSAAPMILLYRTVSRRLSADAERAIPAAMFAGVYLLVWMLSGIPVYGAYVAVAAATARWPSSGAALPYATAAVLVAAGIYQLTAAKRACLRHCESPLGFLMRRWRSGYGATLRLAADHAAYCVGCCWGLMAILVTAGAMSLAWVVAIALVVFAEKVLPRGWRTARGVGIVLIALGVAVAVWPELASIIGGRGQGAMAGM